MCNPVCSCSHFAGHIELAAVWSGSMLGGRGRGMFGLVCVCGSRGLCKISRVDGGGYGLGRCELNHQTQGFSCDGVE